MKRASTSSRITGVAWIICLVATFVWWCALVRGPSMVLAQLCGLGMFLALGSYVSVTLIEQPLEVCRPMTLFCVGCIYFFALDAAFLVHGVRTFTAAVLLDADTLIALFLVVTIATHRLVRFQTSFLRVALRRAPRSFDGNIYYVLAIAAVGLEYLRRLYFDSFSLGRFGHDLLLGRGGGAFRVGVADDWRVVFAPIQVLFLATTAFADLALRRGISSAKKAILTIVVATQLATLVLDTVRGDLLIALLMPLFTRAAQQDKSTRRLLWRGVVALPLLVLLANTMNYARDGWQNNDLIVHAFDDPRENDLFWFANLVADRSEGPGVLDYKAPFGAVEGLGSLGWQWVSIAVPRAVWENKPKYWEQGDATRGWYAADSVVGDLYRAGGVACVAGGAIVFGVWLSILDAVYLGRNGDGEALVYAVLATMIISMTRDALPFNNVASLLSAVLFTAAWYIAGRRRKSVARPNASEYSRHVAVYAAAPSTH